MPKKNNHKKPVGQRANPQSNDKGHIPLSLQWLAQKRIGGAVNLRGIYFQLLFAIHTAIDRLTESTNRCTIWMEGVEDIDVYFSDGSHLFQIKTSQNSIDASSIWHMKVFQHFWEAYQSSPSLSFSLIHNSTVAKGRLEGLGTDNLQEDTLRYWHQKFTNENISVTLEGLEAFLRRVTLKSMNEQSLHQIIRQHLIEIFGVNAGTEPAFFQALFYWVFEASKKRSVLSYKDLAGVMDSVKQSFSKFPSNPALQHNWISPVSYEIISEKSDSGYYDGKAARPVDIARQLPVRRLEWETTIITSLEQFDVTVIKSSSGQGKSTLAWQAGYELHKSNFSIYQLHQCKEYNEAIAINDFISSRLSVGQTPIIVIDGLNQHHSGWIELAKLLREKPVKILITTRQEDWVRYGEEAVAIIVNAIEIKLNIQEAKLIYREITRNNKLHPAITHWEPIWERVKERGLMIEYIFLLTRGQMIEERLLQQVSTLKSEQGNAAKLEILRLISLADTLDVKISTQRLTHYIQQQVGFVTDRNEVYRQLEKEYYLRFDAAYVKGLHPVRSEHLVRILHSHIHVNESLMNLLEIIDENYIYDYFINAPLSFDATQNTAFCKQAAGIMATRTIPEMVYAIDGLMHLEPYRYWQENKSIFDIVSKRGGMEIFIYDTAPFAKLQTIKGVAESLSGTENSNIKFLLENQQQLTAYSITDSLLFQFSSFLQQELSKKSSLPGFEGLTFLYKWFQKLNICFPDIIKIIEDELLQFLETKDISETADIFHFYSILHPEAYRIFIEKNKRLVVGWIKKKTNTLTIYEEGNDIHINYLLDNAPDRANDFSVYRINIVHSFLPYYEHYCTQAIILPFPNPEINNAVLQNSIKRISPDSIVLGNDFDVHINQIWAKTILDQYSANSTYEWQKQYVAFRKLCLELYKGCTRLIEAFLEQDARRQKTLSNEVASQATAFFEQQFSLKKFPSHSKKYFEKQIHSTHLSVINRWLSSFQNFINQLAGLLNPKNDRDRHLPLINIRAAEYRLPAMQMAYNQIADHTYKYFETEQLCTEENKWLKRLYHTVEFIIDQSRNETSLIPIVASRSVQEWKVTEEKQKLEQLHAIISQYGQYTDYIFYLPTRIVEDETLNYAVVGMKGFDISNEDELWNLSLGLSELSLMDIHFYTFVMVNDDGEASGAFRLSDHYFEQFQRLSDGMEIDYNDRVNILPLIPDQTMLETLEGVSLKKAVSFAAKESFFEMMFNLWRLIEHRNRLDPQIRPERIWLEQMENEYSQAILHEVPTAIPSEAQSPISKDLISRVVKNEITYDMEEICNIMMKKAIQIQSLEQDNVSQ